MKRRSFMLLGAKVAVGCILTQAAPAVAALTAAVSSPVFGEDDAKTDARTLSFYHTHTGEYLDITYLEAGVYDPVALEIINSYLRDFRTSEIHPIDPALLDILWEVQQRLGCASTYEIISGYRSPETNTELRRKSKGVAKRSLHTKGMALDVRLTGQDSYTVRDCAASLQCGGVGYYAASDFVHIDTGRVRTW